MKVERVKVNVLFFGATAEAVGESEIEFEIEEDLESKVVFEKILEAFPVLKDKFDKTLLFSVNQEYAVGEKKIRGGDELGIFTAVSGG